MNYFDHFLAKAKSSSSSLKLFVFAVIVFFSRCDLKTTGKPPLPFKYLYYTIRTSVRVSMLANKWKSGFSTLIRHIFTVNSSAYVFIGHHRWPSEGWGGMMNALTNLQCFNIEGKRTGGQINRATARTPAQICLLVSAKPTLVRHVACCCTGSVGVCVPACMSERPRFRCFLLPDEERGGGRERRMPRRSPRCKGGHFDFSEEVVSRAHLSAPRWFLFVSKMLI